MDTQELIKQVKKIEIKTRGLSKHIFSGEYHSAFKGRGMAFAEVREYMPGDDIRTIDWNVTARSGTAHVKIFEEERELTVFLLVDVSGSSYFGTKSKFKKDLITEFCATLSFSALQNGDKIGMILFSDKIELYIPPKKGKSHILRLIRELVVFEPSSKKTNIKLALDYFINVQKKKSICFLVSDFFDDNFDAGLRLAGRKHDTIAVQVYDKLEQDFPDLGLIDLVDLESGLSISVDSSDKNIRQYYQRTWNEREDKLKSIFAKNKVDKIMLRTDESYVVPLQNFFKTREGKR